LPISQYFATTPAKNTSAIDSRISAVRVLRRLHRPSAPVMRRHVVT
jgi:hypothetical protein